jgi:hypothetical protein
MATPAEQGGDEALQTLVTSTSYPPVEVRQKTRAIYERMLGESAYIQGGDFTRVGTADLERLFELYDSAFFRGGLRRELGRQGSPLALRLAPRMTSAGGKTYRTRRPGPDGGAPSEYEIAISSTLLFQSFGDVARAVRINGLDCGDRLQSLQRVFEHELLHLAELLVWDRSSCSGGRFRGLALRFFGHTGVTHDLVTPRERARVAFGLKVGDRVSFEHEGARHVGTLNRITRRATVLVENPAGRPYSDGGRYAKFYVPLAQLRKADGGR